MPKGEGQYGKKRGRYKLRGRQFDTAAFGAWGKAVREKCAEKLLAAISRFSFRSEFFRDQAVQILADVVACQYETSERRHLQEQPVCTSDERFIRSCRHAARKWIKTIGLQETDLDAIAHEVLEELPPPWRSAVPANAEKVRRAKG